MRTVRGIDALDDEAFTKLYLHYMASLAQLPVELRDRLNAEIKNLPGFVRAIDDRLLVVASTIDAYGLHYLIGVRVDDGIQSLVQVHAQRLGLAHLEPIERQIIAARRRRDGPGMWPDGTGDPYRPHQEG